jgi:hypothetical protein
MSPAARPNPPPLLSEFESQAWSGFLQEFEQDDWMFQEAPFAHDSTFAALPIFQLEQPSSPKGKERAQEGSEVDSTESSALSPHLVNSAELPPEAAEGPAEGPTARLSADQKKANHVASERRRREGIKTAFKELVDLVNSEAVTAVDPEAALEAAVPKKRGRGRKGEGGVTKADVRCVGLGSERQAELRGRSS